MIFDPADTLLKVCEAFGCQATAIEPVERAKYLMAEIERLRAAINEEREFAAGLARRFAANYPPASDGRNTFIILAEAIERRGDPEQSTPSVDAAASHSGKIPTKGGGS